MLDRIGRSLKDSILNPLERAIPRKLSPDMITWTSLIPGLATAVCAAFGLWGWAFAAFVTNRILDGLDGIVARTRRSQSDYGGYLDIMIDFVVYAAIPIGVWMGAGQNPTPAAILPLVALLAVFYVNAASWMYLSALIEKRRATGADHDGANAGATAEPTSVTMPTGVVEGTETVIFFALFLLLPDYYATLFWIMAVGTATGVVQRLVWARRTLK